MSESLANMVRHVLGDSDKPGLPVVSAVHLLKESHDALLEACVSAFLWRGLDGDGITDPTREKLLAAIRQSERDA